ncbi:S9 family peptidase [Deinococcus sonorensis]|uniref:S9 family peptidase n=1 Tax=Deinococcus sonorensis TaxID=309891 RepID=A0ABV8Y8E0_9DEIO
MSEPEQTVFPYGAWPSPLTPDAITAGTVGLGGIAVDGPDVYWLEERPSEAGRSVLVRRTPDGAVTDVTPAPSNVRTRVHEYGGRCYVVQDGTVSFSSFTDDRLYRLAPGQEPEPLTPPLDVRYADPTPDLQRQRLIVVREDHRSGDHDPGNALVAVSVGEANPEGGTVLASGADFYAAPRLSPDGTRLAWVEWDHPNMPWDDTRLMLASVEPDGSLTAPQCVAGGPGESVAEPRWSPGGVLHFVSDRSGWWNLYRLRSGVAEALYPMEAEFTRPHWVFGVAQYTFLQEEQLVCAYDQGGRTQLARLEHQDGRWVLLPLLVPFTDASSLQAMNGAVVLLAGAPDRAPCIARVTLGGEVEVLRESARFPLSADDISVPEAVEVPTEDGQFVHAFLYRPRNRRAQGPLGERPPLLVISHGGPTGATTAVLDPAVQFWTTRGFAVLDVNYSGSTGFGRAYRERLKGQWGVLDVQDCVSAAQYVAARGDADPERLAITGGSAGGYTTLCALTFHDVFAAGASHYGVSDVEALAQETHKFESRYLDSLIGPYPQDRARYEARSPIHFTGQLRRPVVFFQGLDDRVVPPNQARTMYEAVRAQGLPTALLEFPGEGHGFRRAENIRAALEGELQFYGQVFGFTPPGLSTTLEIVNVDR